jgi:hypothetical protein
MKVSNLIWKTVMDRREECTVSGYIDHLCATLPQRRVRGKENWRVERESIVGRKFAFLKRESRGGIRGLLRNPFLFYFETNYQ